MLPVEPGRELRLVRSYHDGIGFGHGNEHAEIADDTLWVISPALRDRFGK